MYVNIPWNNSFSPKTINIQTQKLKYASKSLKYNISDVKRRFVNDGKDKYGKVFSLV